MSNVLPTDPKERKSIPITTGVIDYFSAALAEVAIVSRVANEQHNPGQPLHWAWGKSNDHADCIVRHLVDRGAVDSDGLRHSAKVAWRALALLQEELVSEGAAPLPRAAWVDVGIELEDVPPVPIDVAITEARQNTGSMPFDHEGNISTFGYIFGCMCSECRASRNRGEPPRKAPLGGKR